MHRIAATVLALIITPSLSTPIWVEREFARASALIDSSFIEFTQDSAETVDHGFWDRFLASYVSAARGDVARVDYGAISAEEIDALGDYVAGLSTIDIPALNRREQLSLWINLYNAATIELIAKNYPVKSIKKIDGAWDKPVVSINGRVLSLDDIEHGIVRPAYGDNRIHYALNCASIGCPNLAGEAFRGATLEKMLDDAARVYINHPRGVTVKGKKIITSKIYGWYREDFGEHEAAVLKHFRQYASPNLKEALKDADDIDKYVYDWDLNDKNAK